MGSVPGQRWLRGPPGAQARALARGLPAHPEFPEEYSVGCSRYPSIAQGTSRPAAGMRCSFPSLPVWAGMPHGSPAGEQPDRRGQEAVGETPGRALLQEGN